MARSGLVVLGFGIPLREAFRWTRLCSLNGTVVQQDGNGRSLPVDSDPDVVAGSTLQARDHWHSTSTRGVRTTVGDGPGLKARSREETAPPLG